ncbi:unnamed protein product, partial [Mesorhabditis belari]|uniref:DNA damage-binding protein 1 n=1 Tax=Mesorhabditis belari TaxID=2138241 RepID=A0AAF3FFF0_9BILA
MSTNYVATCKKPTVVTHSFAGNFTGEEDLNLILAKVTRIEINLIAADGLRFVQEIPIYGRILDLAILRVKGEKCDSIVIITDKLHMAVLSWRDGEVVTRAHGCLSDKVGRISETGIKCIVHSKTGLLAFRIYDGLLKIVEWDDKKELKAFNVRFEDLMIVDLVFLHTSDESIRLGYIYHDHIGRHLKTVELNMDEKEFRTISSQMSIEAEATKVVPIPQPYGGVAVVGHETVLYNNFGSSQPLVISPPVFHNAFISCVAPIDSDGQRFLMGGKQGELMILVFDVDASQKIITDIKVEVLGRCSFAECLCYIDNGVVYVGSRFGDSQLIRLNQEPNSSGSFVSILDTFANVGPIRDMVLLEQENGQTQLLTCSGAFKDGSLRIIRNGIGIEEKASVDFHGVKSIFSLSTKSGALDDHLIVSGIDGTHVLRIEGEELEEPEDGFGLETNERTLYASSMVDNCILQITPSGVHLIRPEAETLRWHSDHGEISVCAVNSRMGKVLVASGRHLHYLSVSTSGIDPINETQLEYEAACLDISSLDDSGDSKLVAIGLWTSNARRVLPRSCFLGRFDNTTYMLVALGDGTLFYFQVTHEGELVEGKKASLGTVPLTLKPFVSNRRNHVFVCSDRPAIIYSSNNKLIFSNVNVRVVNQMCPLNSEAYSDCMVMCDNETMVIGRVDDIEKLHIRTVPLGESPARLAYMASSQRIAVLVSREMNAGSMSVTSSAQRSSNSKLIHAGVASSSDNAPEVHSIVVLDANTFEVLHAHQLGPHEEALSILVTRLGNEPNDYLIVGTAFVNLDETESKLGRILVFSCADGDDRASMRLVHEKEVRGAVYSLAPLHGKLLASINSSVRLFEWKDDKELRLECSHFQYIQAMYIKSKGDIVLVGDLMRSMGLLSYKSVESSFEEVAKPDAQTHWMTAIEIFDADTCLGADSNFNIFTSERERNAQNAEDRQRLVESGVFYLGDAVNVFRNGSLITRHVDGGVVPRHSILFGTIDGSIGAVLSLEPEIYRFALDVEQAVANSHENVLRISLEAYRSYKGDKSSNKSFGFVDGDLVESLLDLPRERARKIVEDIRLPNQEEKLENNAENVLKLIEDLSRIH